MMIEQSDLMPSGLLKRQSAYEAPVPGSAPAPKGPPQPWVYFLEAKGAGLVKIGTIIRADTIQRRIEQLQAGCPYDLRLAFILDGGGRREEYLFHRALDPLRFRSEWFRREGILAEMLDAAKSDPDKATEIAVKLIRG